MPHIIKVDIEGYESMALEGGAHTLRCARPYLILEINPATLAAAGSSPSALLAKLRALDYTILHIDASQVGLTEREIRDRPQWLEYPYVSSRVESSGCLFDVLAIPSEKA